MIIVFGYPIGMLSFLVFSFIAGMVVLLHAIFKCEDETPKLRIARGVLGFVYAAIAILAFMEVEPRKPYTEYQEFLPLLALLRR